MFYRMRLAWGLALMLGVALTAQGANILSNGDFKNGTSSWTLQNGSGDATFSAGGGMATLTRMSSSNWVRIYQDVSDGFVAGRCYRLVWKAKVGTSGTAAVAQPHYYWMVNGVWQGPYFPSSIASSVWSISETIAMVPANATQLRMGLRLDGANTSLVCDGMYLSQDVLLNGGFQNGLSGWSVQATSPNAVTIQGTSPVELRIHRENTSWMRAYQDVTVSAGHRYLVRAVVRSTPGVRGKIFYYYYNNITQTYYQENNQIINMSMPSSGMAGVVQECIEIPPSICSGGVTNIRLALGSTDGTGDVYYSMVSVLDMGHAAVAQAIAPQSGALIVDGYITDAFWSNAHVLLSDFRNVDFPGLASNADTTVKAAIHGNELCMQFENMEPNPSAMVLKQAQDGWCLNDDRIDVYVMYKADPITDLVPTTYVRFSVNALGAKYASVYGQPAGIYSRAWYSHGPVVRPEEWQAAARIDSTNSRWTAEMTIPLTKLTANGANINPDCLAINVVRFRPQSETATTSGSMVAGTDDADVSQFSRLALSWTPGAPLSPVLRMSSPLTPPDYLTAGHPLFVQDHGDLIVNGGFQDDLANWTFQTGGVNRVQAIHGIVRMERLDATSQATIEQTCTLPTYGGTYWMPTYRLRCKVWSQLGGTARIGYRWGGQEFYQYETISPNISGQWQTLEYGLTAPSVTVGQVTICLEVTGQPGTRACFKEISLTPDFPRESFEAMTTLPLGWTAEKDGDSTIAVINGMLEIHYAGISQSARLYKNFYVKPNTWYTLRSKIKRSGSGQAQIYYYLSPDSLSWRWVGNLVSSGSSSWQIGQALFQTGANDRRMRLALGPNAVAGTTAYFEDVILQESIPIPSTVTFSLGAGVTVDNTPVSGTQSLLLAGLCDDSAMVSPSPLTVSCSLWSSVPSWISSRLASSQLTLLQNRSDAYYLGIGRDANGQPTNGITVMGGSNQGVLRGLSRLAMLASQAKSRWPAVLPLMEIIDAPRLDYRTVFLSSSPSQTTGFVEPQNEVDLLYLLGMNATAFPVEAWSNPATFPYGSPSGVGSTATTKNQWSDFANYSRQRGLQFVPMHMAWHSATYFLAALPPSYPYLTYAVNPSTIQSTGASSDSGYKNLNVWNSTAVSYATSLMGELVDTLNPKAIHIGHDEVHYDQMVPTSDSDPNHTKARYVRDGITVARDYLHGRSSSQADHIKTHLWGDMLIPDFNGRYLEYSGKPMLEELIALGSSDLVIYDWMYDESDRRPSVKLFSDLGFKVVGASWWLPLNVVSYVRDIQNMTLNAGMSAATSQEFGYCLTTWNNTSSRHLAPELVSAIGLAAYMAWSGDWTSPEHFPFPPGYLYHLAATNYSGDDGKPYAYGTEYPYVQNTLQILPPSGALIDEAALVAALAMPSASTLDCLMDTLTTVRGVKIRPFQLAGRPAALPSTGSSTTVALSGRPSYLTFLHTVNRQPSQGDMASNNSAYNHRVPGIYRLTFSNGSTADLPVVYRENVMDWNSNDLPRHGELGLFGVAGERYQVNIPTWTWKVVYPDETVTLSSITLLPSDSLMNLYWLGISTDH